MRNKTKTQIRKQLTEETPNILVWARAMLRLPISEIFT